MEIPGGLNEAALVVCDEMEAMAGRWGVGVAHVEGARLLDCGVSAPGGLQAGLALARVCMAGHGEASLAPSPFEGLAGPSVQVYSDRPVLACLASQYAGWQVKVNGFMGMGSGPMRAHLGTEEIFEHIPGREQSPVAVGVLETTAEPGEEVVRHLADRLVLPARQLTLAYAPAGSIAGSVQVVARSLETALHKLHELKFDLSRVVCGYGVAPLPPATRNELTAIGLTNDAILYGGRVTLWVACDTDRPIEEVGPKVPSAGSKDHGRPFAELFAQYGDFYKIDPLLFSPAEVTFQNLTTGTARTYGKVEPEILRRSFGA